jgi:hypothetical protein
LPNGQNVEIVCPTDRTLKSYVKAVAEESPAHPPKLDRIVLDVLHQSEVGLHERIQPGVAPDMVQLNALVGSRHARQFTHALCDSGRLCSRIPLQRCRG